MPVKTKTITVAYTYTNRFLDNGLPKKYRVVKVQNSTEYNPADMLSKKQVDELCAARDWTVNVIGTDETRPHARQIGGWYGERRLDHRYGESGRWVHFHRALQ